MTFLTGIGIEVKLPKLHQLSYENDVASISTRFRELDEANILIGGAPTDSQTLKLVDATYSPLTCGFMRPNDLLDFYILLPAMPKPLQLFLQGHEEVHVAQYTGGAMELYAKLAEGRPPITRPDWMTAKESLDFIADIGGIRATLREGQEIPNIATNIHSYLLSMKQDVLFTTNRIAIFEAALEFYRNK